MIMTMMINILVYLVKPNKRDKPCPQCGYRSGNPLGAPRPEVLRAPKTPGPVGVKSSLVKPWTSGLVTRTRREALSPIKGDLSY